MYDPAKKELVWKGQASKTIDEKASPEKRQKNLDKAMTKLLKDFPAQAQDVSTRMDNMTSRLMMLALVSSVALGCRGSAPEASTVTPAVIPAQTPQAFTLAAPLEVEIMTAVAVRADEGA